MHGASWGQLYIKNVRNMFALLQDILTEDLQSLALYTEDWLGLRTLDQQGRLHFREMQGDHMDFNWDWFTENIVLPFLV